MNMSRIQKWVLAGGLAALVLTAAMLTLIFGGTRLAPIDGKRLAGVWMDDVSGSVLEFDAAGRVTLTDFVYLDVTTGQPSPGHDAAGEWYLPELPSYVGIQLDEPIEGISGISFDSVTCGSETCLRYGPEDGRTQTFHRQE